jgi:hypothetical protein
VAAGAAVRFTTGIAPAVAAVAGVGVAPSLAGATGVDAESVAESSGTTVRPSTPAGGDATVSVAAAADVGSVVWAYAS